MYCILKCHIDGRYLGKSLPTVHWTNTQAAVLLQRRGREKLERLYDSLLNIKHAIHNNKENYLHDFVNL